MSAQPTTDQIPVVVLTIPEANTEQLIMERAEWDAQYGLAGACLGEPGHEGWVQGCVQAFCLDYGLDTADIERVDLNQTRTREELEKLPDFCY
jgi:hypothetical protein